LLRVSVVIEVYLGVEAQYLLSLPIGAILKIGESAKIRVTGMRNPCKQLDALQKGLMKAVLDQNEDGNLIRKAGITGIVVEGGEVLVGSEIVVEVPLKPYVKLERV